MMIPLHSIDFLSLQDLTNVTLVDDDSVVKARLFRESCGLVLLPSGPTGTGCRAPLVRLRLFPSVDTMATVARYS